MPVNVMELDPPRQISVYTAQEDDTLLALADRNFISLEIIEVDNPMLARRPLRPGDIVYIALVF
jgi:hypothetical protein